MFFLRGRKYRYFVGDFETTVYEGQSRTDVWAAALVELFGGDEVTIYHDIGSCYRAMQELAKDGNIVVYFHNLRFDGSFWLDYLLKELHYRQAIDLDCEEPKFEPTKSMRNNEFTYSISNHGQWYKIVIKTMGHIIQIRDSLKLLPFSVKRIGQSFDTRHKKLDMEYKGFRYPGCEITDKEKKYIANDVLVIKEALEIMHEEGHNNLTIGSCCLAEYRKLLGKPTFARLFPNIYGIPLDKEYGEEDIGSYIRNSYKGGWCYAVKQKAGRVYHKGCTVDVNSLYPSMMHSDSGNRYPVGEPTFWKGDYIPPEALKNTSYYFIRIKTRFQLKDGYLPFMQIKGNHLYKGNECLETSDILGKDGEYHDYYKDLDGNIQKARPTLTLTWTDFELMKEHYRLYDFEILDGCWFRADIGIFDVYIDKYKEIKINSKGAKRELAKLFMNNLYGKLASSKDSTFKVAKVKEDGQIVFGSVQEEGKEPGYIPCGSAITSYARNFTIRAAQKNYHGPDQPGFIYADTDSLHCDLCPDELIGIAQHPADFCCWKVETEWDYGKFIRAKTYIEHVIVKDGEAVVPFYNIKCAGMPDKCKAIFLYGCGELSKDELEQKYTGILEEQNMEQFLSIEHSIEDFNYGLIVPGKLMPKRIPGGIVLVDTCYEMRR